MAHHPILKSLAAAMFCTTVAVAQDAPPSDATKHRFTDMCIDRQAEATGALAYLEARLALTDQQQPLFERWKKIKLASVRDADCLPPPASELSIIDSLKHEEKMLRARLAEMKAETPALEALIAVLTTEQKNAFRSHLRGHEPPHGGAPRHDGDGPQPGGEPPPEF
jgi:hypothetical protein